MHRTSPRNGCSWKLPRPASPKSSTPGREVSEHEWKQFLAENVTPDFPEGLTVWHAEGQWQNDSSRIVQEIAYLPDTLKNRKIQAVIEKYRSYFRQQSVMRVTEQVQVAF